MRPALVLVLAALTTACLADSSFEYGSAELQPLAGAYAVRVRSTLQMNYVDPATSKVLSGPHQKSFETLGVVFLSPVSTPIVEEGFEPPTPAYDGRFRLCSMAIPGAGQGFRILEDPYPNLPEYPLSLQPDASGWTVPDWAMVIGAELTNPVGDSIDFGPQDRRVRKVSDGNPGMRVGVTVATGLGFDKDINIDLVIRAVLSGGRITNATDGSGAIDGQFARVVHTIWALQMTGAWVLNKSQSEVNAELRARQAPWPTVGEQHVLRGAPIAPSARTAREVCAAAAAAYPP